MLLVRLQPLKSNAEWQDLCPLSAKDPKVFLPRKSILAQVQSQASPRSWASGTMSALDTASAGRLTLVSPCDQTQPPRGPRALRVVLSLPFVSKGASAVCCKARQNTGGRRVPRAHLNTLVHFARHLFMTASMRTDHLGPVVCVARKLAVGGEFVGLGPTQRLQPHRRHRPLAHTKGPTSGTT